MAEDSENNIQWVILAICGALIIFACLIVLCVFCFCGVCGMTPGNQTMCGPQIAQGPVVMVAPAQNIAPQPTVINPGGNEGPRPVPDPAYLTEMKGGGDVSFSGDKMKGDKMKFIKVEQSDPNETVGQVIREYYKDPEGPPELETRQQREPKPINYVVDDVGYDSRRQAAPYSIIRSRDPGFDNARWKPPWQRRK